MAMVFNNLIIYLFFVPGKLLGKLVDEPKSFHPKVEFAKLGMHLVLLSLIEAHW